MKYQICNRCVMDTSAPEITFTNSAGEGICSHCMKFDERTLPTWQNCTREWLDRKILAIKKANKDKCNENRW